MGPGNYQPTTINITIDDDLTPTAPNISNYTATVGTSFSRTLATGSGGDPPLSYSVSNLPSWLSFSTSTRVLSGTPTSAASARTLTYRVTDDDGDFDEDTFTITVNAGVTDLTPTAPNISNYTATVGTSFSRTLSTGSGGDPPLSYSVSNLPSWLSFSTSTRVLSGTPTSAASARTLTYRVTDDDGDFDEDTFTITVNAGVTDLTPTAPNISNYTATVGTSFSRTLSTGSGGDPPLSYSVSNLPSWLSFSTSTRVLSGTPTSAASARTLTYRVTDDDGDFDEDTFTITVNAGVTDLTPTAPNISNYTATVGTSFSRTLSTGSGGDPPLSYSVSNLPSWLSFSTSTRVLSGTPTSAASARTLTYRVTDDDGDFDEDTFTITVNAEVITGPAVPGNVRLSEIGEWALHAQWNTVTGATRYQLRITDTTTSSISTVTINSGSVSRYHYVQTTVGRAYTLQARAGNASEWGDWSASPGPSATPSRDPRFTLNGTWDENDQRVELSWSRPSWLNDRFVLRRDPNGYIFNSIHFNASGNPSNHNDPNVTPGQTYEYIIEGRTSGFSVRWSTRRQITIPSTTTTTPGVPTSVSVTGDADSRTVTWQPPNNDGGSPITSYRVGYRPPGGSISVLAPDLSASTRSWTHNLDLTTEGTYTYYVDAGNSEGFGDDGTDTIVIGTGTAPGVPTSVSATVLSSTSIRLDWSAGSGGTPDGYDLFSQTTSDSVFSSQYASTNTTYTFTGLSPSTQYRLWVRAQNSAGDSDWATVVVTTDSSSVTAPGTPSISVTDVDHDTIRATWSAGSGGTPTSYQLRYREGTSGDWITVSNNAVSPRDIDGLDPETLYQAEVRATNSAGSSLYARDDATTPAEEDFPITLTATAGVEEVSLSWTNFDSNYPWQQLWSHTGDGNWVVIRNQSGHDTTYTHTGLTAGVTYYYRVRASTAGGQNIFSDYSNTASATPTGDTTTAPGVPTSVSATGIAQDSISVSWNPPSSGGAVETYSVRHREGSSGVWITITNISATSRSRGIDGLNADTQYQAQVRAVNSSGSSSWTPTTPVSARTMEATEDPEEGTVETPSAPRRLQGDARSDGVALTWLIPTSTGTGGSVSGYNVWRWYNDEWQQIATDTGSTTTNYTDTATLIENEWYWYTVRAINGAGTGEWSAVVPVLINPEVPSAPRRLNVDARSSGVLVDWEAPVDSGTGGSVSGYNIWRWYAGVWTEIVSNTNSTATVYTDTSTNLLVGEWYGYVVRARNSSGPGEWSETSSALINPELPSAPLRLVLTETTDGIVLNWLPPEDTGTGGAINGYNIWRYSDGVWSEIVVNTGSTSVTYTDRDMLTEGWHWYAVRARNSAGPGEWSETSGVTTATNVPGAPTSLIVMEIETGVQLTWEEPLSNGGSEITGYRIWRSNGIDWVQLVADTGNTETTYLDTVVLSLGAGIYFYRVNALTANGTGDFSAVASIEIGGILVIEMPERDSNHVFGNWWIIVQPEITNPVGNFLTYEWTQIGGITINNIDSESTYIKFPNGGDDEQLVSATLTVVDMVANNEVSETIEFLVVAEPERNSLFYSGTTSEIPGVVWYSWKQVWEYLDGDGNATGDVGLVDSRRYETRAYVPIREAHVETNPAYVGALTMDSNGTMVFNLSDTPDDPDYGVDPNPQLTDYAEDNFGLALQMPSGLQYKWRFVDLINSDTTDPYLFSATSVSNAGQINNAAFREILLNFWNARLVIVDIAGVFIDWGDLEVISVDPTISIDVVDTTADSETVQTISGAFDDFQTTFEDIGITISATGGTLGGLERDDVAGFWSISWTAPSVTSGTQSAIITITAENSFNRETTDSATIVTRPIFQPIFPDNLTIPDIVSMKPTDKLKDVTNIVKVPVRQFNVTDEIELWNLQESIELGASESRIFLITYPDDAAPRSHLAVNNWLRLKLQEDPEFVFGPTRNTFGTTEGDIETSRRERNEYANQTPEWLDEYKNSSSLMVRLLGASRSGAVYEVFSGGEWEEVSPIFPDYAANSQSDGGGDDRTGDLEIEVDDGGNTRKIIVKNTNITDTIFLTTLRSRGRVIQEIQKTVIEIRDEASISSYGPKDYTSESQFLSTIDHAHEYGTQVLFLYSEPLLKVKVRFQVNENLYLAYSLQLSDRVALTRKGETEDYFIESIEHIIEPGLRHDMQITLSPAPFGNAIILGTGPPLGVGTLAR